MSSTFTKKQLENLIKEETELLIFEMGASTVKSLIAPARNVNLKQINKILGAKFDDFFLDPSKMDDFAGFKNAQGVGDRTLVNAYAGGAENIAKQIDVFLNTPAKASQLKPGVLTKLKDISTKLKQSSATARKTGRKFEAAADAAAASAKAAKAASRAAAKKAAVEAAKKSPQKAAADLSVAAAKVDSPPLLALADETAPAAKALDDLSKQTDELAKLSGNPQAQTDLAVVIAQRTKQAEKATPAGPAALAKPTAPAGGALALVAPATIAAKSIPWRKILLAAGLFTAVLTLTQIGFGPKPVIADPKKKKKGSGGSKKRRRTSLASKVTGFPDKVAVAEIQSILYELGYDIGKGQKGKVFPNKYNNFLKANVLFQNENGIDGDYGDNTAAAVKKFQEENPSTGTPDGTVGNNTWKAMMDIAKGPSNKRFTDNGSRSHVEQFMKKAKPGQGDTTPATGADRVEELITNPADAKYVAQSVVRALGRDLDGKTSTTGGFNKVQAALDNSLKWNYRSALNSQMEANIVQQISNLYAKGSISVMETNLDTKVAIDRALDQLSKNKKGRPVRESNLTFDQWSKLWK